MPLVCCYKHVSRRNILKSTRASGGRTGRNRWEKRICHSCARRDKRLPLRALGPAVSVAAAPIAAPLPPLSPPPRIQPGPGESPSGSGAGLSPGAELAAGEGRAKGRSRRCRSREPGLRGQRGWAGAMRRCRGAGLAALGAVLLGARGVTPRGPGLGLGYFPGRLAGKFACLFYAAPSLSLHLCHL